MVYTTETLSVILVYQSRDPSFQFKCDCYIMFSCMLGVVPRFIRSEAGVGLHFSHNRYCFSLAMLTAYFKDVQRLIDSVLIAKTTRWPS